MPIDGLLSSGKAELCCKEQYPILEPTCVESGVWNSPSAVECEGGYLCVGRTRSRRELLVSPMVRFANTTHFAPTLPAIFANTPRNVGYILPGQCRQCFCSPLSDLLGQHGALTQRYQGRKRPAVSLSPFLRVGQE